MEEDRLVVMPSPDWNGVTLRWKGRLIDGAPATGRLIITSDSPRFLDDDAVQSESIIADGVSIIVPIVAGYAEIEVPATDDPDITPNGFTYTIVEQLDKGVGRTIVTDAPLEKAVDGIDLNRLVSIDPSPGTDLPPITRAELDALAYTFVRLDQQAIALDEDGTPYWADATDVGEDAMPVRIDSDGRPYVYVPDEGAPTIAYRDAPNGLAPLDSTGRVPQSNLPTHLDPIELSASYAGLAPVQATITANGTLTPNTHSPIDATTGAKTMTLANATAAGKTVTISKTDPSANTVTISGNLRGSAGTYVLYRQYDAVTLVSKSDGSWWPSAIHRDKASTDANTAAAVSAAVAAAVPTAIAPLTGVIAMHRNALETNGATKLRPYVGGAAWLTSGNDTGTYAHFGASVADSIVEAVVTHESSYNAPVIAPWNNGGQHVGLAARWADKDNCPVIAMFSVDDNSVQIASKNAGAETIHLHTTPTVGTFQYGQKVRIKISMIGTSATVTWTDDVTDTLLHTHTYTVPTLPAAGYAAWHTYSSTSVMTKANVKNSSGAPTHAGALWVAMNGTDSANAAGLSTSGKTFVLTTDNSGTGNVNNNWAFPLHPARMKNGVIRGTINRTSGRMAGVSFRVSDVGAGYYVMYDNNSTSLVLKKGITDGIANVGSATTITALAAGTDYPFELVVKDDVFSFTINGATVTWSDSTYKDAGWVGLVGYQGVHATKDLLVLPDAA